MTRDEDSSIGNPEPDVLDKLHALTSPRALTEDEQRAIYVDEMAAQFALVLAPHHTSARTLAAKAHEQAVAMWEARQALHASWAEGDGEGQGR